MQKLTFKNFYYTINSFRTKLNLNLTQYKKLKVKERHNSASYQDFSTVHEQKKLFIVWFMASHKQNTKLNSK